MRDVAARQPEWTTTSLPTAAEDVDKSRFATDTHEHAQTVASRYLRAIFSFRARAFRGEFLILTAVTLEHAQSVASRYLSAIFSVRGRAVRREFLILTAVTLEHAQSVASRYLRVISLILHSSDPFILYSTMDRVVAQQALTIVIRRTTQDVKNYPANQWTSGLVRSQLELLESYWSDYQPNHAQLLANMNLAEHSYFSENEYSKTQKHVVTARAHLYDVKHDTNHDPNDENAAAPATNRNIQRLP